MNKRVNIILDLIADEIEAIKGYKDAIVEFKCPKVQAKLLEIMHDEEEHKRELCKLLSEIED